ncbi:hypothetical protein ACHAXR_003523 [Thalassiosira sp. AJA248-18]
MAPMLHLLFTLLVALGVAHGHEEGNSPTACVSDHCHVQLSPDLMMRYRIHLPDDYDSHSPGACKECKIKVQLMYAGYTWLGIGVSLQGKMVGSHAVIGQPGKSEPKTYYLDGKEKEYIKPTQKQLLEDTSIEFIDDFTIMEFTTTFFNWGTQSPLGSEPMGISLTNPSTFIYAHGSEGETTLAYHGPNSKSSHTIENIMSLSTSKEQSFNHMILQENITSTKKKWMVHGIMAFLAWGVLAPVAITAAILRDCNVPDCFKGIESKISKKMWLYIHIGLNTANAVFTLILFSIAVSTINFEAGFHWEHAHSKMGLALFIIVSFQLLGGYLRPSSATLPSSGTQNPEEDGEGGTSNEDSIQDSKSMPTKSTLRQTWELLHSLLGIALFLFGVWQMYGGIELYHVRYENSNFAVIAGLYISWMAMWTGAIIGGVVYKWFLQHFQSNEIEFAAEDEKKEPNDIVSDLQEFS